MYCSWCDIAKSRDLFCRRGSEPEISGVSGVGKVGRRGGKVGVVCARATPKIVDDQ